MTELKCDRYGATFARKENLTRPRNRRNHCRSTNIVATDVVGDQSLRAPKVDHSTWSTAGQRRPAEITIFDDRRSTETIHGASKNPKIQALINEIIFYALFVQGR